MLSKSMTKCATENVPSRYVQWMGNDGTGAPQATYKWQHAILVVDKVNPPPPRRTAQEGGGGERVGYHRTHVADTRQPAPVMTAEG